jgi:GntR family transcriptional repressor for pyruvate dehydrogenase complex
VSLRVGHPLLREPALADRVAEHMMDLVLDGTLSSGMRLPPERILAEQFGVSRTVIREAVRTLVSRGVLETRGGSGSYVRGPDPAAAARSVTLQLRLHHGSTPVPYTKIHEVRRVLEVEIAALAAERAQVNDIAALEREVERQRRARHDRDAYVASDVAFHAALAMATHNELFAVLLNSIQDVMMEVRRLGFQVPGSVDNGLMHHERVLAAVKAGDAAAAARAMTDHLHDSARILREGLEIEAARVRTG